MSFLRGVAQTLDLQPATQAFVNTRRRAEDRKHKLEDEQRRLQEKAASLGVNIEGMDRDAALGAIGEYQSHDAVTARAGEVATARQVAEGGYVDADAMRQHKEEMRGLEIGAARAQTPEYREFEAEMRRGEKEADEARKVVAEAAEDGINILNDDGTTNVDKYNEWMALRTRMSEAKIKADNARAKYWSADRGTDAAGKLQKAQTMVDQFVPGYIAELDKYPDLNEDAPELAGIKAHAEARLKIFQLDPSSSNLDKMQAAMNELRQVYPEIYAGYVGARGAAGAAQGQDPSALGLNRPPPAVPDPAATPAVPESTAIGSGPPANLPPGAPDTTVTAPPDTTVMAPPDTTVTAPPDTTATTPSALGEPRADEEMPKLNTQHQKTYDKALGLMESWEKDLDARGITGEEREGKLASIYELAYGAILQELWAKERERTGTTVSPEEVENHPLLVSMRKRYPQYAAKFAEVALG